MFKLTKSAFALAALFTISALQSAHGLATLRLEVFNVSNVSLGFSAITDEVAPDAITGVGGVGEVANALNSFNIGGYKLNVDGTSTPITGSTTTPNMSMHIGGAMNAGFTNGNYAVLTFMDTLFTTTANTGALASITANVGFPFGTVLYETFVNGSTVLTTGSVTSAPPGFNTTIGGTIVPTTYSLTQKVTLKAANNPGNASISVDANLTIVPDGGFTLSLLGGAMVGLFLIRRKQQAA